MDYDLSEEQRILEKSARDFLRKECPKELVRTLAESDEGHSPQLWKKMAGLGWMGLMLPEACGGSGCSFLDLTLLLEVMGYHLCPGPFFSSAVLGGLTILAAGSDDQKAEFLPKVASGEWIFTVAWAEGGNGFEVAPREVTAVLQNSHWVITGTKLFVPDALAADRVLCVAKTGPDSDPEERATVFLVGKDDPGLSCAPLKTVGWEKQCEVVFDHVRVPEGNVLHTPHRAGPVMRGVMEKAAVARCAEMIGHSQAAMDMTLDYAKERVQFGRPIGSFQAVQHHFASMWLDIHTSRNLVRKAAWKISQGMPSAGDAAMAKMRVGEISRKVTKTAHQIFGAIGFTMEHDLHLFHRRVLAGDMSFGNSDFHVEEVARHLGL